MAVNGSTTGSFFKTHGRLVETTAADIDRKNFCSDEYLCWLFINFGGEKFLCSARTDKIDNIFINKYAIQADVEQL